MMIIRRDIERAWKPMMRPSTIKHSSAVTIIICMEARVNGDETY